MFTTTSHGYGAASMRRRIAHGDPTLLRGGAMFSIKYKISKATIKAAAAVIVMGCTLAITGTWVQDAKAAHGYNKAVSGNTGVVRQTGDGQRQVTVCVRGDNNTQSCVLTYSNGEFPSILVASGHYYYVTSYQQVGCEMRYRSTSWFWVGHDAPASITVRGLLYPNQLWYRVC